MDIDLFIEKNQKAIFRYCYSLCGRRELAEDLAQDTFLKVLANYSLLVSQSEGQILAWTFTVAKNLTFDALRSKRREELFTENSLQQEEAFAEVQYDSLEDIVGKLSPAMREAILMKFELGMSSREIGQQLSVPEGTVRRRIQIGLEKMKAILVKNNLED
jgi:RNA polymerase sigma-70 factor, ECF subfamily